jgi:putative ABC transport system permease protein
MKALLPLAARSAWDRRATLLLTVLSIALSTLLLLGVERIRTDARAGFADAVSGTDLVVGARTGPVQLMLHAVFHLGSATHNIRWRSVQDLAALPQVAWVVPLSLGDSHRGFPVLATAPAYFDRYRHGDRQALRFQDGKPFAALFDAVVGAEVADRLGYRVGQRIALSHGDSRDDGHDDGHADDHGHGGPGGRPGPARAGHADLPFTIVGVLARTGTPVDRTVHIGLPAMEAIHLGWAGGAPVPGVRFGPEQLRKFDLAPREVTAALVGLEDRAAVFAVQRQVGAYAPEPLLAVLPGVALDELWTVVGAGEQALLLMSGLVALVSLAGLVSVVLAGLQQRRRELAVLRAVGAGPRHILLLLAAEGALTTLAGLLLGLLATGLATALAAPWLQARFGIALHAGPPTASQGLLLLALLAAGWAASALPAVFAYRLSLADGLSPAS